MYSARITEIMSLKELHFQARKKINKIAADLKGQGLDSIHEVSPGAAVKVEWKAGQFYFDGEALEFACAHKIAQALAKGGPIESIVEELPQRAEVVAKALKDLLEAPKEELAPAVAVVAEIEVPNAQAPVEVVKAEAPAEAPELVDEKSKAHKGRGKAKKG